MGERKRYLRINKSDRIASTIVYCGGMNVLGHKLNK